VIKEEKYTIPARESTRTLSVTCDICKTECPGAEPDYDGKIKWKGGDWGQANTIVRFSTGYDCPSGGSHKHRDYHVCPKCFAEKLEPWLASQGAQPNKSFANW